MGTYVVHRIWVGIAKQDVPEELIEKLESHSNGCKGSEGTDKTPGFSFSLQEIHMHGETIGYGMVVHELDWKTTEEKPEIFEYHKYQLAVEGAQARLEHLFEKLRLPLRVHPYHHIDLGG
ncbi:MAG TPA: hypothetical protein VJJ02_04055 [Candidatus Paceibacterota bacterium]